MSAEPGKKEREADRDENGDAFSPPDTRAEKKAFRELTLGTKLRARASDTLTRFMVCAATSPPLPTRAVARAPSRLYRNATRDAR